MADNSVKIAELEAILQAGASRVVVDGHDVTYDFAEIRRQLAELKRTDDTLGTTARTAFNAIDMSGAGQS